MSDPNKDKPKIIIDSDWKAEAQREKERLAEEEAASRPAAPTAAAEGPGVAAPPQADLAGIVNILAMQALVGLGGMRGAGGQPIPPNLEIAKYNIDLLSVLEEKTRNNVSPEEKRMLDLTLYELRMRYVQTVSAASNITGGLGGEPG